MAWFLKCVGDPSALQGYQVPAKVGLPLPRWEVVLYYLKLWQWHSHLGCQGLAVKQKAVIMVLCPNRINTVFNTRKMPNDLESGIRIPSPLEFHYDYGSHTMAAKHGII